jgi:hypothetical protein
MSKIIKVILLATLIVIGSLFITYLSRTIPIGENPQIQVGGLGCGRNLPDSPISTHTYGLPVPYITNYSGNPSCGFSAETSASQFAIDAVFWGVVLLGILAVPKYLKRAGQQRNLRKL